MIRNLPLQPLWLLLLLLLGTPLDVLAGVQIGIINFAPLSAQTATLPPVHPRVLSGEFRSKATTLDPGIEGTVLPAEYLQRIHANLLDQLQSAGLQASLHPQLAEALQHKPDYLLFGAVRALSVSRGGLCRLSLRLVEAQSGRMISEREIEQSLDLPKTPFETGSPVHMVGLHKDNFHPQRVLLDYLAWQAGKESAEWLKGVMQ